MEDESPKAVLYAGFARVGRALGSPARIELLNLLAQGERGVEELAAAAGLKVSNTSAQLKAWRGRAGDLAALRHPRVLPHHWPAGNGPGRAGQAGRLRGAAGGPRRRPRLAGRHRDLEPVTRGELRRRMREGGVLVLDVRPAAEYAAAHIAGAVSIPVGDWPAGWPSCPPAPRLSRTAAAGTA